MDFDLLAKTLPWFAQWSSVAAYLMTWRMFAKPITSFIVAKLKETDTKEDDYWVAGKLVQFTDHRIGRVVSYAIFDLLLSVNLKAIAKELKNEGAPS